MTRELNTLLTALYVLIDDHVVETPVGRGRRPLLSDSELITLAVAQVLQGFHCERRWIRHIHSSQLTFPARGRTRLLRTACRPVAIHQQGSGADGSQGWPVKALSS